MIVVGIILAVLLIAVFAYMQLYWSIARKDAKCDEAWKAVDEQILLRNSLIPEFVEALKADSNIDAKDVSKLVKQCAEVEASKSTSDKIKASVALSTSIGTCFAKYGNHSDPSSPRYLLDWEDKFSDLDLSFGITRARYNECVQSYNKAITGVFGKLVAWSRFRARKGFDLVDDTAELLAA